MAASCLSGGCERDSNTDSFDQCKPGGNFNFWPYKDSFMAVQGLLCALSYHMLIFSAFICSTILSCDLKFVIF